MRAEAVSHRRLVELRRERLDGGGHGHGVQGPLLLDGEGEEAVDAVRLVLRVEAAPPPLHLHRPPPLQRRAQLEGRALRRSLEGGERRARVRPARRQRLLLPHRRLVQRLLRLATAVRAGAEAPPDVSEPRRAADELEVLVRPRRHGQRRLVLLSAAAAAAGTPRRAAHLDAAPHEQHRVGRVGEADDVRGVVRVVSTASSSPHPLMQTDPPSERSSCECGAAGVAARPAPPLARAGGRGAGKVDACRSGSSISISRYAASEKPSAKASVVIESERSGCRRRESRRNRGPQGR